MASAQGGPFFPASTESRILSQLQYGVAIDQNYQIVIILFFYCLLFQFVYYWEILYFFPRTWFHLFNYRIFVHAENNFNHIKESFLDYQRRNNSSVSLSQAITCTCSFTGFDQPFCPQLNICPYLQERATKSFIL